MVKARRESRCRKDRKARRRGSSLLMCLFLVVMVSTFVLNIARTQTLQLAATRNGIEYEQALYLANAGVHHACAQLATNSAWRGTVTSGVIPPSTPASGYSATAVDDGLGNVTVTSTGYSGNGARTVSATVEI